MGCDIHGLCEVKVNGKWQVNTERVFKNPYYKSDAELADLDKPDYVRSDWEMHEFEEHPSDSRNYDWFAVLADVRNGRGFAGISTGCGFSVIADPKGVPADCTPEWKEKVDQWDGDMHSHSYLTLDEFDKFNWDQSTVKSGIITLEEYKELKPTGASPESWCGMTSGPGIVVVDEKAADKILAGETVVLVPHNPFSLMEKKKPESVMVSLESGHIINVNYNWSVLYREWFDHKIKNVIEPMRKLKEKYEDVRYVFGFDN